MVARFLKYFKTFEGFSVTILFIFASVISYTYFIDGRTVIETEGIGFFLYTFIILGAILLRGIIEFIAKEYASYIATVILIVAMIATFFLY